MTIVAATRNKKKTTLPKSIEHTGCSLANRLFSLIFFSATGNGLRAIFQTISNLKHRDEGSRDERKALISLTPAAPQ